MMNKEQSGKIDMLTGILNLPVIILVSWYFMFQSTIEPWIAIVAITLFAIPSHLLIRRQLKRRLYPDSKAGN